MARTGGLLGTAILGGVLSRSGEDLLATSRVAMIIGAVNRRVCEVAPRSNRSHVPSALADGVFIVGDKTLRLDEDSTDL